MTVFFCLMGVLSCIVLLFASVFGVFRAVVWVKDVNDKLETVWDRITVAGNDSFEYSQNTNKRVASLHSAVEACQKQLSDHCRKV